MIPCNNCGAETADDAVFKTADGMALCVKCYAKCNKTLINVDEGKKIGNYPLINLSSRLFYPIYELSLWLSLIIGTVGGGIIGYSMSYTKSFYGNNSGSGGAALLGATIGLLVSFCYIIISSGILSIFLKMNENIEKLEKKTK